MKQILRKAIALILAVTAVLFPLAQMATLIRTTDSAKLASSIETAKVNSVVIEAAIEKHYDGDGWNFEPRTSDGVHITPQGDGMHLKGHPDEAFFVFEKTQHWNSRQNLMPVGHITANIHIFLGMIRRQPK